MSQPSKLHYPGKGWIWWWFDHFLVLIVAALFWVFTRFFFGWRIRVRGQEDMPHEGRVILLTNHPSYVGIFLVIYAVIWPWFFNRMNMFPIVPIKQKYIKWLGPIRWLLSHWRVIEVPEKGQVGAEKVRREVVGKQVDTLEQYKNCLLWVYGECTRTLANERLGNFRAGVGRVVAEAVRNRVDFQIVFVWDDSSQAVWPRGKWLRLPLSWRFPFYRPFPADVFISKPLSAADPMTKLCEVCHSAPLEEVGQEVADHLQDLLWAFAMYKSSKSGAIEIVNGGVLGDLLRIL